MATARAFFTATLLSDGRVLIAGGMPVIGIGRSATSAVEIFDPKTRTFVTAASMPIGRAGHTATLLQSGKVLVVGGYTEIDNDALTNVDIYDPASDTWSSGPRLQWGRTQHAAVLLNDGRVLITGGASVPARGISPGGATAATLADEIYDPRTDAWSVGAMPIFNRPVEPTATLLLDGRVLVVGGQYMWNSTEEALERPEIYNSDDNRWSPAAPETRSGARQFQTATLLPDGRVLMVGGMYDLNPVGYTASFDPSNDSWTQLANLNEPRCGHGAALLHSGRLIAVGSRCWAQIGSSVEEFDVAANRWFIVSGFAAPWGNMQVVALADGSVLAVGGEDSQGATALAELFSPN
ncbi:MAG TPA: kelch repeat-containing protein [Candidatus Udaeobacter sp.]|nr:kelch repeat-containing protein [Candidatus Udaeobacter sp.]